MKKILSIFFISIICYGQTASNNITVPCKEGINCNKQVNEKNVDETKKEIYRANEHQPEKIVKSNTLDNFNSENVDENICKAFIVQNKNRAYDIGYKSGKRVVKAYIAKILLKYDRELSILFPIESMYIENILEPPVIKEYSNEYVLEDGKAYRAYEKKYKIVQNSKFVTSKSKKSWKTFLLDDDVNKIENIDNRFTFEVKLSNDESCNHRIITISKKSFERGLKDGKDEAILLYKYRLKKLYDYMNSLYLYYRLYIERKLEPPIVGSFNTAVSTDKESLVIDENYYKILEPAKFNDDVHKWKTYLIEHSRLKEIK